MSPERTGLGQKINRPLDGLSAQLERLEAIVCNCEGPDSAYLQQVIRTYRQTFTVADSQIKAVELQLAHTESSVRQASLLHLKSGIERSMLSQFRLCVNAMEQVLHDHAQAAEQAQVDDDRSDMK